MIVDLLLIAFFVLLNGFFVASEFAIVKVRESQLSLSVKNGKFLAKLAHSVVQHLDAYLSACQLGITLASLALGWLGEPVVEKMLTNLAIQWGLDLDPDTLHSLSFGIAFLGITALHIVFGELVPKAIAIRKAEATTFVVALPLRVFYVVFYPMISSMNWLALKILSLIGIPHASEHEIHTSEELQILAQKSQEQGELEKDKYELVKNALEFDQRTAGELMVSRSQIDAIDLTWTREEIMNNLMQSQYSRLLCYKSDLDHVCGILHQKDIAKLLYKNDEIDFEKLMYKPLFVPEDRGLNQLLNDFKKSRVHLCVVVDEYGGTLGVVTLEDVLEELVGEILDEDDVEGSDLIVQKISDTEFIVKSDCSWREINELLPRPLEGHEHYHTLSGIILSHAGGIPNVGDQYEIDGYQVEVLELQGKRIVQVCLRAMD